ncbi:hypothetical protein [Flavobacterium psychrophilum]|uniref:Crassvirus muzzle protein C-terminal domain-containing protein n=1 Tax=Flavobacterium psychrophilum TaxID=96345 RepID=A0A7U2NEG9_FLAPS|nr:hypothetical protein [Flavobacterium psychrophilum]QRE03518.1 hypothetical protein H0H26_11600 [Flavobacterium psychrophilum]
MAQETLSYSDNVSGWTAFHSYKPDMLCKLNNRFFSIKDGQLYLHNDRDNDIRNNFYGEQFNSKIVTIINESNSEDKIFKTLVLEGNKAWETKIRTNITESTIKKGEYNHRESRFFAHTRGNEIVGDLHGNMTQGIGVVVSSVGTTITYGSVSELINIGDSLFQLNGAANELIGTITSKTDTTITVNAVITLPVNGYFSFATKNARVEGGNVRGYYAEISLENNDTDATELFSIESNIIKSYV